MTLNMTRLSSWTTRNRRAGKGSSQLLSELIDIKNVSCHGTLQPPGTTDIGRLEFRLSLVNFFKKSTGMAAGLRMSSLPSPIFQ